MGSTTLESLGFGRGLGFKAQPIRTMENNMFIK
jgi:hypothetical protein